MKKFMTVLLVVAVMFTFSFGSAFAAPIADSALNANVNTAQGQIVSTFTTNYNNAVAALDAEAIGGVDVDKAAWQASANKYYEKEMAEITTVSENLKKTLKGTEEANATVAELVKKYTTIELTQDAIYNAIKLDGDVRQAALYTMFPQYKAAAEAALNAVDLTVYSTTTPADAEKTYYEEAKAEIDAALEEIAKITVTEDNTRAEIIDAVGKIGIIAKVGATAGAEAQGTGALDAIKTVVKDGKVTGYVLYKSITTIAQEESAALTADAKRANLMAQVNQYSAAFYAAVAADSENLAANMALKDAYVEIQTYLIENTKDADLDTLTIQTLTAGDKYADAKKAMDEVKAYVAKHVVTRDANGELVYDATKVEKALTAQLMTACKAAKTYAWTAANQATAEAAIICDANKVAAAVDSFKVEKAVAALEKAKADAEANYYAPEYAEVVVLYDAAIAKAQAATTDAELAKAVVDATALGKIDKKSDVNGDITATVNAEVAKLNKYAAYLESVGAKKDAAALAEAMPDVEWYAEKGARTKAEVEALYNEAVAAIDAVPTVAEVKAQKAAVEAMIAALPTTITSADVDAVAAAVAAVKAYPKNDIVNQYTLNLAVSALSTAMQKDINDAAKALPAEAKVTVADKAAVQAVADMVKAYEEVQKESFKNVAEFANVVAPSNVKTLADKIQGLEKAAVIAAVNALPVNITAADKAAVEAARAAYDAYVAEYSDAATGKDARVDLASVVGELKAAEEVLAELAPVYTDADAKAYVQDLKIVARSVKTAKGNVKVTINADVEELIENGYTVEYKFYRSEKARAKYGTAKKVSEENVYTNTAGKKGVQYFYKAKLVVKNAEGEVVATTPLTQCKYATRVWSK